ncbi:MalY/PatB family protein [Enterococcus ureasiticus]|uniref:cysteine-S-conjugate beta-lyase n=1 Tax=Enterococcus ureasiticus TaxID=903984 RepID=A0A1E5GA13_9ENTE|nr:aminotransferase class I/II-fold pyridoxal phosphate-dependent enzyme [Enterococcus ureasiticus]OEG09556.1 beta-cystathionase [Enterococcus ureasiticus]
MTNFNKQYSRYGTYSTQWDYVQDRFGEEGLLPFSISDMDFQIPSGTRMVLAESIKKGFFGYTRWNHLDYKRSISNWFSNQFDCFVEPEWCIYSPSVIYSLSLCLQLLTDERDKILSLTPCYDAFFNCISQNQRQLLPFSLENYLGKFTIDFNRLEQVIVEEKPKAFLLCNPHNPTGRVFTKEELEKIIDLCNSYHLAIISDEIHMDVRRPEQKHLPLVLFKEKIKTSYALLSSPSKTFNTPGLGGSYVILPDEALREQFLSLLKGRDGVSSISYPALLATMDCYNNQEKWVKELNKVIDENFDCLKEMLSLESCIQFEIPEATYLGWLNLQEATFTMDELQKVLVQQEKVAIMKGITYGVEGANYLRFNLGCPKEKVIEGAQRLIRAIHSLNKK